MIYLAAALCSLFLAVFIPKEKERIRIHVNGVHFKRIITLNIGAAASGFPVFLVSALRYGIGTDYFYSYVPQFKNVLAGREIYFEKGFTLLLKLIAAVTSDYQWVFVVTSFLFVFIAYKEIYAQSADRRMSIILFFVTYVFFISLNNIRQSLASVIVLGAMRYLERKEYLKYILLILLAGCMHQMAFIFLLFVFIRRLRPPRLFFVVFPAVVWVLKEGVYALLLKGLVQLPRFQYYFSSGEYSGRTISRLYFLVNFAIMISLLVIESRYPKACRKDFHFSIIKWCEFGAILVCCLDGLVPAAYRILRVFTFMQFVYLPGAVRKCRGFRERMFWGVLILGMLLLVFLDMYISGSEQVFPYRSIFNKGT